MAQHVQPFEAGTLLKEKYEIIRVLGKGGFAITYLGKDLALDIEVAIKQVLAGEHPTLTAKERYRREVRHVANLANVPEVTMIRDYFEENDDVFIVMEYVDGTTLYNYVKRQNGRMGWEEARAVFSQVASALKQVHKTGVIHRDISPENIMLLPGGKVKILDFGALKDVGEDVAVGQELEKTTTAIVKHGYSPIEQYQSRGNLGPWTDVYGTCATLFFCLTGEVPPDAPGRALSREELSPEDYGVTLPEGVGDAIKKGMEIRVQNRIKDMEELEQLLFSNGSEKAVQAEVPEEAGGDSGGRQAELPEKAGEDSGGREPELPEKAGEDPDGREPEPAQKSPAARWIYRIAAAVGIAAALSLGIRLLDRLLPEVKTEPEASEDGTGNVLLTDAKDLDGLLRNPEVDTITVPGGVRVTVAGFLLEKELVIEEGAELEAGWMEIKEGGHVQADGILDARNSIIRTEGDAVAVTVGAPGQILQNENTVLWTQANGTIADGEGAYYLLEDAGHHILMEEEAFFASAVHVSSLAELDAAVSAGKPVIIEADISFESNYWLATSVYVREGVTITGKTGDWIGFGGDLLINHGRWEGGITLREKALVINYGTMIMRDEAAATLWGDEGSLFINMGDMECDNCSRVWTGASFYNVGRMQAYDFSVCGGSCFNYGEVAVKEKHARSVWITTAGRLYNFGTFAAEDGTFVDNCGRIDNSGYFYIESGAAYANDIFYNTGCFEFGFAASTDDRTGVFYGNGEYRIDGITNIAVWKTADRAQMEDVAVAGTAEELLTALSDDDAERILLTGNVEIAEDLQVDKPLFVAAGLAAGGELLLKNSYVFLLEGGRIEAEDLQLENSLLFLEGGELVLSDASLTLGKSSALAADGGTVRMARCRAKVEEDSVVAMPSSRGTEVLESTLYLDDSDMIWNGRMDVSQSTIVLAEKACLYSYAKDTVFDACDIQVREDCLCFWELASVTFRNGCTFTNEGEARAFSWGGTRFLLESVSIQNTGVLYFDVDTECGELCTIQNDGELYMRQKQE